MERFSAQEVVINVFVNALELPIKVTPVFVNEVVGIFNIVFGDMNAIFPE